MSNDPKYFEDTETYLEYLKRVGAIDSKSVSFFTNKQIIFGTPVNIKNKTAH